MAEPYKNLKIESCIRDGYVVSVSECYNKGWKMVSDHLGLFAGFAVVYSLILGILGNLGNIGTLVSVAVSPALNVGFYQVAYLIQQQKPVTFGNFFDGFARFGDLFKVNLIMLMAVVAGLLLLILPGIYLAVAYSFSIPLVWFMYNGSALDTLKTSREIISKNWWSIAGFYLTGVLVSLLGILCLGVGIFVSIPVIFCAQFFLFDSIVGTGQSASDDPFDQLVSD